MNCWGYARRKVKYEMENSRRKGKGKERGNKDI